jgi:NAD(P)-dependent dehydrogenase (short-subunit alcohol dehydrogenase family)
MNDRIVIVTGGNGLLGKEIISHLRTKGAFTLNLDITATTDLDQGQLHCDITSETSIKDCVGKIEQHFGRIDGLVNNAYPRTKDWGTPFESITVESWKVNIEWQLNSHFLMSQEVLRRMRIQKSGSIVNIASIYGVIGNDFSIYENTQIGTAAEYSAIKGGLINFTRYLSSLYGQYNVRVNCVSPGGIFDNQDPKFVAAYENKVPMKRMGTAEDIAPSVTFLLSDDAKYITGHNLIVDGGWTAI